MKGIIWLVALWLTGSAAYAQTDVVVQRGDNARTGLNVNEPTLVAANVNVGTFGKLYSFGVDGYTYAQPLYKSSLSIPGKGTFNVVFVATQHGSVFAFDADTATPLWQVSFINPAAGITTQPTSDTGPFNTDIVPEVSITATPVIDPASGTLYVVAKTEEAGTAVYRIHALDVTTGAQKLTPVVIQASVPKTGGGTVSFSAHYQQQRPGLVFFNGTVYLSFGSSGDTKPWAGWVLAYSGTTLAQTAVFCTSASGVGGGVWSSGTAPAVDATGNLFFPTANGAYNGSTDWANSFLKLSTAGGLSVADYFTEFNESAQSAGNLDLGTSGPILLPDSAGTSTHPHLLVGSGKDGAIYVVDRDNMGHYNPGVQNTQIVQWIPNALGASTVWEMNNPLPYVENNYSTAGYWQNRVYFCGINDYCKLFTLSNGLLSTTPTSHTIVKFVYSGAEPVVSAASSSATSAILWAVEQDTTDNVAVLHAYDATNLATELYNSNQAANHRDSAGPPVKFVVPTVINGKVFVGAQSEIDVYGLLAGNPQRLATPTFSPTPTSYANAQAVTITAHSGATIYYTLDGSLPTLSSAAYSGPITVSATTTLNAIAVQSGFLTSPVATATYTIGSTASIAYVQGNYATPQTPQSSVAVRFTAAQQQGDLNVVVVGWNDSTATVGTVADSSGNAYRLAVGPTVYSGAATQAIYYAANIVSAVAGSNAVTVTFNGSAAAADIRILEYTGVSSSSPLDATAAAIGSSASASSGAATTSSANDLIVGADLTVTYTTAAGSGFTSRMITSPDGDIVEDRIGTAMGSYAATAPTSPAGPWIMQMAAFKAAASGGAPPTPTAPANLSAGAVSSSEIDLSWGAATESGGTIVQYVIERCQGTGCSSFAQIGATATTTFQDHDSAHPLAPATPYTYRVRAQDASGRSGPYSNLASATTLGSLVPTAPGNLTATAAGATQISLSWGAATESGGTIAQYLIERCQGAGCSSFTQIGASSTLSFGDTGLSGSSSYSYRVRAQDGSGTTGPYSGVATAPTGAPVLSAPTSLAASAASSSQINLTWGAASETGGTISGYLIERCQGAGCSTFTQVATASGTSFNDTGLTSTTAYSYRVRATDAAGDLGPYSNIASATTASGSVTPITFVQKNYATPQTPQSSVAVRFTAAQQQGDLNVVVVGWNDSTATVGTVTDLSGNVYHLAVGPTIYSGTATQAIYYAANIVGAAANANTVTVTFTSAAAYADIRILEYSGIATTSPLDVTAAAIGNSASASSGAVTTTNANDLIFGADLTVTDTTGAGPGFTSRMITVPDSDIAEDRIVTATGSYAATASTTPGAWIMQMAAFRQHP